ncbi:hypothetical protein BLNAU_17145 [Blattamonas nauphoetae]|uniref:Uncharacterized protein n=1 Tax=Blattamonas nauphoetae TaxID=2049346 RepID=A0ABQ9X7N7_9EUKA|nr:hypothetical protein BLNAU_17145 [Blattamonas nauphoetae]
MMQHSPPIHPQSPSLIQHSQPHLHPPTKQATFVDCGDATLTGQHHIPTSPPLCGRMRVVDERTTSVSSHSLPPISIAPLHSSSKSNTFAQLLRATSRITTTLDLSETLVCSSFHLISPTHLNRLLRPPRLPLHSILLLQ